MSKIKVKFFHLFNPQKIQEMNTALLELINFKAKRAALKYDLNIKLNKAVANALKDFEEMRKKLCEDNSVSRIIELKSGHKTLTSMKIVETADEKNENRLIAKIDGVEVEGNKVVGDSFDIKDMDEFDRQFRELLETEIELDCYPIKLSKLEMEEDCSVLNFIPLEPFIEDNRGENEN